MSINTNYFTRYLPGIDLPGIDEIEKKFWNVKDSTVSLINACLYTVFEALEKISDFARNFFAQQKSSVKPKEKSRRTPPNMDALFKQYKPGMTEEMVERLFSQPLAAIEREIYDLYDKSLSGSYTKLLCEQIKDQTSEHVANQYIAQSTASRSKAYDHVTNLSEIEKLEELARTCYICQEGLKKLQGLKKLPEDASVKKTIKDNSKKVITLLRKCLLHCIAKCHGTNNTPPRLVNNGDDCFLNSVLHSLFGFNDVVSYLDYETSNPVFLVAACKYLRAWAEGSQEPIDLASDIRKYGPNNISRAEGQVESETAFLSIISQNGNPEAQGTLCETYTFNETDTNKIQAFSNEKHQKIETLNGILASENDADRQKRLQSQIDQYTDFQKDELDLFTIDGNLAKRVRDIPGEPLNIFHYPKTTGKVSLESLIQSSFLDTRKDSESFKITLEDSDSFEITDLNMNLVLDPTSRISAYKTAPERLRLAYSIRGYVSPTEYKKNPGIDVSKMDDNLTFSLDKDWIEDSSNSEQYAITFFSCWSGSCENRGTGGHYFSFKKVGDTWWKCNDTTITKAEIKDVKQALSDNGCVILSERVHTPS